MRCMHEASLWRDNCFVTLTYGRDRLPAFGSLDHRDFQLFMKRVRKYSETPVRFYMSGEYGPQNSRPHYHSCLFNFNLNDGVPAGKSDAGEVFFKSPTLDRLWGLGHSSIQPLTRQTAGYCARYIMTKQLGQDDKSGLEYLDPETGEIRMKRPEYNAMSLRPGIGRGWFDKYHRDVFPADRVVVDGREIKPPKRYYAWLAKLADVGPLPGRYTCGQALDAMEFRRQQRAAASAPDNTDERRRVREVVQKARVRNLQRGSL